MNIYIKFNTVLEKTPTGSSLLRLFSYPNKGKKTFLQKQLGLGWRESFMDCADVLHAGAPGLVPGTAGSPKHHWNDSLSTE